MKKRGRETSVCKREKETSCLSHALNWGPGPQPRHVPWLWIQLAAFGLQAGTQSTEPHQPGRLSFSWLINFQCSWLPLGVSYNHLPSWEVRTKAWRFGPVQDQKTKPLWSVPTRSSLHRCVLLPEWTEEKAHAWVRNHIITPQGKIWLESRPPTNGPLFWNRLSVAFLCKTAWSSWVTWASPSGRKLPKITGVLVS